MRLFVGISLSENFIKELHNETLPLRIDQSWRNIHKDNWHVTTCFIGDFKGDVGIISEKIQAIAKDTPVFELSFNKITTVSYEKPRMVWYKGIRNSIFTELCEKLNRSILNKKPDHKPTPHITIARSKKEEKPSIYKSEFDLSMEVGELQLWQSFLNQKGSNYKIIERFPLKLESQE